MITFRKRGGRRAGCAIANCLGLVLVCLFLGGSGAWAATSVYLRSGADDPVGGGVTRTFDPANSSISATFYPGAQMVQVQVVPNDGSDGWYFWFAARSGNLVDGNYARAFVYQDQRGDYANVIYASVGSSDCTSRTGWFRLLQMSANATTGAVQQLAVDFYQYCDAATTPLYGGVRIGSGLPVPSAGPDAVAGVARIVDAGQEVALDGGQSFSPAGLPLHYAWQQTAGPAVTLLNADGPAPVFVAPAVPVGGAQLTFELTVTDGSHGDSDTVQFLVHNPADPQTRAYFHSEPGDPIGLGFDQLFDSTNTDFYYRPPAAGAVYVGLYSWMVWDINFSTTQPPLTAGKFYHLGGIYPGLFSVAQRNLLCDHDALFQVLDASYDSSGNILSFAADFQQYCTGLLPPVELHHPQLFGAVRINSAVPLFGSGPRAVAPAFADIDENQHVQLDGRRSSDRQSLPIYYTWKQTAGPPAQLLNTNGPVTAFISPQVRPGGADLTFELTVTDSAGLADTDTVDFHVVSKSDPQTWVKYYYSNGQPGERSPMHELRLSDGPWRTATNIYNGVTIYPPQSMSLLLAAPNSARIKPGHYEHAERFQTQSPDHPGIQFGTQGCNQIQGRFDVYAATYNADGTVASFATDVEQHCELNDRTTLYGKLRYNYLPPGLPVAKAGTDRVVLPGARVTLDASASYDPDGSIVAYDWRQVSGDAVTLAPAGQPTASFTAPPTASGTPMVFELMVTDNQGYEALAQVRVTVGASSRTRGLN